MLALRALLFLCFVSAQTCYALEIPNHCDHFYLTNRSGQTLEAGGIYPDSKENLKTIVLKPYEPQQSIALQTLRTCDGNTSKIHCNAMWLVCHKDINLVIKTTDTGTTLFSGLIHANDTVSINTCLTCNHPSIVLINDIPQY